MTGATHLPKGAESRDAAAMAFILVVGLVYFSQYYDHGFNYGDEGSVLLNTARLLEEERPFVDLAIGYGLPWYYPLVLLFKLTGVHFIAARIYFLSIALEVRVRGGGELGSFHVLRTGISREFMKALSGRVSRSPDKLTSR